jgi:hypothetical protein
MRKPPIAALLATLALLAWSAAVSVLSAQAALDRSSAIAPVWSAHWIQANPGQPLVLILDPGRAATCFVGLHGPSGAHSVGWRFQPGGHRLSLTLLTHPDAVAGQWLLRASCQRQGSRASSARALISVPAPGGTGLLAAHGDMRVQVLSGT